MICKLALKSVNWVQWLHYIIQQLEAEGHLLDIVAGMKGYTAVVVDIIGYGALKPQNSQTADTSAIQNFLQKKRKTFMEIMLCGQLCHNYFMAT